MATDGSAIGEEHPREDSKNSAIPKEKTHSGEKWSAYRSALDQKTPSSDLSADLQNRIANQVTEQLELHSLHGRCRRLIESLSPTQVSMVLEFLESNFTEKPEVNHGAE